MRLACRAQGKSDEAIRMIDGALDFCRITTDQAKCFFYAGLI